MEYWTRRPFLAFSFTIYDLQTRPDRQRFFEVLMMHYNTAPTASSSRGHYYVWENYRREVRQVNPDAALGMYFSAITTQNPTSISHYQYPTTDYESGDFNCDNTAYANLYDPRPDEYGFYAPRYYADRSNWEPWGPGPFGRWPFYEFQRNGWVLPQTTYLCRPVIDVGNPDVVNFVINTLLTKVDNEPNLTALSFDNGAMLENEYNRWPGWGQQNSPYGQSPPDEDFFSYLDQIRWALNARGVKLILNSGQFERLAPHADILMYEGGLYRSMGRTEYRDLLLDFKGALDAGGSVVQRYEARFSHEPFETHMEDWMFFLASSMLLYENARFGIDPMIGDAANFRFYPEYFLLPSYLGRPIEPLQDFDEGVYVRRFENGIVFVNDLDHRYPIPNDLYEIWDLDDFDAPRALRAGSGTIVLQKCIASDPAELDRCVELFRASSQTPSIPLGDLNCDNLVNFADENPFVLAMLDPVAYGIAFPYCDRWAADMDQNGVVDEVDYQIWYYTVYRNGEPPDPEMPGDLNCDGYLDNFDIDPYLTAFYYPTNYEQRFPDCERMRADLTGDGQITQPDLDAFMRIILERQ
ncbi:MAG: hypothetical protein JNG88_08685 [Phycisphaerales bacterium]|nr:hypothetical protein [Phycisphaerales bacterium]